MSALPSGPRWSWRLVRGLAPPLVLFGLLIALVVFAVNRQLESEAQYDEGVLREWIHEARVFRQALPELARTFLLEQSRAEADAEPDVFLIESIQAHLDALGDLTRSYRGQLPLFPVIYRMELRLPAPAPAILWNALLPVRANQARVLDLRLAEHQGLTADLRIEYQLHAFARSPEEQVARRRLARQWLGLAMVTAALVAVAWVGLFLRRERQRELHTWRTKLRADEAEKRALEEKLARQQAEIAREESERTLLEQRVARQQAEQQALELQSQWFANMSIMAGSYAHNIKNLLVRPRDLLRRCLDDTAIPDTMRARLDEVNDTLGSVTERTQQILRTVRRDPRQVEWQPVEVGAFIRDLARAWSDLATQRWKVDLHVEVPADPVPILADRSHLEQALENLICNARDATFERRAWLRDQARLRPELSEAQRKQAILDAAAWRGSITLRARHAQEQALIEVVDNGIGMTPEVLARCTEAHFSTKKANAVYEGMAAGLGLGLSFTKAIAEAHGGVLTMTSTPGEGTTARLAFPQRPEPTASPPGTTRADATR